VTRRYLLSVVVISAFLALLPATAAAQFEWSNPEPVAFTDQQWPYGSYLAPGGTGLITGFYNGNWRAKARAPGGPLGPFTNFSFPGSKTNRVWFAPNGDALITHDELVAYRTAGPNGTVGPAKTYFVGADDIIITSVSFAPNGDALVGFTPGGGRVFAAFRPAGPNSDIDMANAQEFGTVDNGPTIPGGVNVVLDPGGGAVVLWSEFADTGGFTTYQAVRPPGEASFGDPAEIPGLGAGTEIATAASGHAVVGTRTHVGSPATNYNKAVKVAIREPGEPFGAAQTVDTLDTGPGTSNFRVLYIAYGITDSGDALVAYTKEVNDVGNQGCGEASGAEVGAFAALGHDGAMGSPQPIGGMTFPLQSKLAFEGLFRGASRGVAAAGDTAVVSLHEINSAGDHCDPHEAGDTQTLLLQVYKSTGAGLGQAFTQQLGTQARGTTGQNFFPRMIDMDVSPDGGILALYTEKASGVDDFAYWLRAYEDPDATGVPPDDPGGPGPPGGGSGVSFTLVPRDLLKIKPIPGRNPKITLSCPPENGSTACFWQMGMWASRGVVPKPEPPAAAQKKRGKKKRAVRLGGASASVPGGETRSVKIKLTRAGRKAIRGKRAVKVRLTVGVRAGDQTGTFVAKTKLKPAKKKKKKR
jgi:hypothetical protein